MSRKIVIAGNWKMNKTAAEGVEFVKELAGLVSDVKDVEVVVCPTFTALSQVVQAAAGTNVKIGAQNIHWAENGAYTGEISAEMLKETGVEYVIIGHSERRQYFGETDETVNQRLVAALNAGLIPMVCIGELLNERESGKTEDVLKTQIVGAFKDISVDDMEKIIVAYEPVWAIGTGKTATPEMAEETHSFVRSVIAGLYSSDVADKVRIQYGGSMKPGNSAELISQPDIDGGLVGGASLQPDTFAELIKNAI
jgi:triosephosphate isomerase